jgi:2-dehydropantoate 2-reductase
MSSNPRRVVFLGAGAIGAGVGGLLWASGVDVLLIARGPHGRALAENGLDLRLPGGPRRLRVPVGHVEDVRSDDLVVLATMGHDTTAAVATLPADVPLVSFQNGLAPLEELAGREVIAGMLYVPAERRAPGVVVLAGSPHPGAIFLGRWPSGAVGPEVWFAKVLTNAGFRAEVFADIAPWIRAKALTNLGGIHVALCDDPPMDLLVATVEEARACFRAQGVDVIADAAFDARIGPMEVVAVDGLPRVGGSTRHALARGDRLETEWLHGYFVRLGERLGVPTPINAALVEFAARATAERWVAGKLSGEDLWRVVRV